MQVNTEIGIYNFVDEELAIQGLKKPEEVRWTKTMCVVDSGATALVLPEDMVTQLGLRLIKKVAVRYADGRIGERWLARGARVEVENRSATTDVLVEKKGSKPLLGHFLMEMLDLIVDPREGKLKPRQGSPEMPLIEQLNLAF